MGAVIHPVDQLDYDKYIGLIKSKISLERFESAWAEGASMGAEEAYAYAVEGTE
jgi:hypothetical protein